MKFRNNIKPVQVIWNLSEYNQIRRWIMISKLVEDQNKIMKLNHYTSKYDGKGEYIKNTEEDWWVSLDKARGNCLPALK